MACEAPSYFASHVSTNNCFLPTDNGGAREGRGVERIRLGKRHVRDEILVDAKHGRAARYGEIKPRAGLDPVDGLEMRAGLPVIRGHSAADCAWLVDEKRVGDERIDRGGSGIMQERRRDAHAKRMP